VGREGKKNKKRKQDKGKIRIQTKKRVSRIYELCRKKKADKKKIRLGGLMKDTQKNDQKGKKRRKRLLNPLPKEGTGWVRRKE